MPICEIPLLGEPATKDRPYLKALLEAVDPSIPLSQTLLRQPTLPNTTLKPFGPPLTSHTQGESDGPLGE